ncbi:hypothetical protein [Luteolibacter soli]|uniref:Uncharacterized protein n=1 Tax=Luteolibacter soli TaxID=3135280 RepID=A0ABU9AWK0_9BACT
MNDPFPPPNPSIRWFRVVVWLMPTCIAFTTLLALDLVAPLLGGPFGCWLFGWGTVNLATTYGLGLFDGKLRRSRLSPDDVFPPEAQFLILQLIIVPPLFLAGWAILSSVP